MTDKQKDKLKAVKIGKVVADYYDTTLEELFKTTRKRNIVQKRQLIFYLCCKHTSLSLNGIAWAFYKYCPKIYDHATVIHSKKTTKNIIDTDKGYREEVQKIEYELKKIVIVFIKNKELTKEEKELLEMRMMVIRACRISKNINILKNELIAVI